MPDINPDFSAPGASAVIQIASWALGLCLIATMIAFVGCLTLIAFKGFGNQQLRNFGAGAVIWTFAGVAALGSLSAIWAFVVGFDLGI